MVKPEDPVFEGFKRAYLLVAEPLNAGPHAASFAFRPHILDIRYEVDSQAACATYSALDGVPPHSPPAQDCTCGFYAVKDHEEASSMTFAGASMAPDHGSSILLNVQLYGTVIEGTKGFRGSHQRVLSVDLDPGCVVCGRPATKLVPSKLFQMSSQLRWSICDSVCDRHTPPDVATFMPSHVASSLRIDVGWGMHRPVFEFINASRRKMVSQGFGKNRVLELADTQAHNKKLRVAAGLILATPVVYFLSNLLL